MENATIWWLLAVGAVGLELATGTFYLLMLALGLAAGTLAAHAGGSQATQLVVAAIVGGAAVVACYLARRQRTDASPASGNRDVNLDIGETVEVAEWQPDGSGHVVYRGARWAVRHAGSGQPRPGRHVIRRVEGNRLHVERVD